MAFNGPPREEQLDQDWLDYHNFYAGRFFWLLNYGYERHYPVIPGVNRVIHNPPLPPADQVEAEEEMEVVGLDDGAVFQLPEPHREDGDGVFRILFDQLDAWRWEEGDNQEEEEINVVGSGYVAEPHRGGGDTLFQGLLASLESMRVDVNQTTQSQNHTTNEV